MIISNVQLHFTLVIINCSVLKHILHSLLKEYMKDIVDLQSIENISFTPHNNVFYIAPSPFYI